jgi:predicted HD superfamily hydrolase involved in NAD metabolism
MMELQEIEERLRQKQNVHRFSHTMGVRYTAICLAMCYGSDLEKAAYAGLLHDCAKHMSNEKLLEKSRKHGLPVTPAEEKNPFLLHAKMGAWLAENKYGVTDPEILGAITWHTTGRPEMTLLEKIVFTADYIEPDRQQAPNLQELRQLAFTDLDQCVCLILEQTLAYLQSGGGDIDPTTELTYQYYLQLTTKRRSL